MRDRTSAVRVLRADARICPYMRMPQLLALGDGGARVRRLAFYTRERIKPGQAAHIYNPDPPRCRIIPDRDFAWHIYESPHNINFLIVFLIIQWIFD